jgi:glycogen synthase
VTGFVAANFEAEAFAAAIETARRAARGSPRVTQDARAFAEAHFGVDAMVRRHAELYRSLVRAAAA